MYTDSFSAPLTRLYSVRLAIFTDKLAVHARPAQKAFLPVTA